LLVERRLDCFSILVVGISVNMPHASSPVAFPAASSVPSPSPRKRRKLSDQRDPLREVDVNLSKRRTGPFLADDSEDEDEPEAWRYTHAKGKLSMLEARVPAQTEPTTTVPQLGYFKPIARDDDQDQERHEPSPENGTHTHPAPMANSSQGTDDRLKQPLSACTASGKNFYIREKCSTATVPYEQLIASRSTTTANKAQKSYYGIDIHRLLDDAALERAEAGERAALQVQTTPDPLPTVEEKAPSTTGKRGRTLMWTEKYRAKKFTDLIGDERTHRQVLRWLKAWDPVVFPGSAKPKPRVNRATGEVVSEEKQHRKILLLTGPPGLGKTTLAHVCARQAGYEVQEINASDERSSGVVRGRIKDMVGTENVKGTRVEGGKGRKAGRPVCVVVDEVDGVVSGSSGGGEGGFVKALIDLVKSDQKNASPVAGVDGGQGSKRRKKGERFRMLRPLVLICNDVYHPSLRPLRQSSFAEIVHVRRPPLAMVVSRMQEILKKEGVPCDTDGVRRLCETTWGVSSRKDANAGSGTGEGDIRSIMVVSEWVASKLRASNRPATVEPAKLTRKWFEDNILNDLAHGGGAARSLGRGGAREVVERVFLEGAGFPKTNLPAQTAKDAAFATGAIGVAEAAKRRAMERLREMTDMSGDSDRIVSGMTHSLISLISPLSH